MKHPSIPLPPSRQASLIPPPLPSFSPPLRRDKCDKNFQGSCLHISLLSCGGRRGGGGGGGGGWRKRKGRQRNCLAGQLFIMVLLPPLLSLFLSFSLSPSRDACMRDGRNAERGSKKTDEGRFYFSRRWGGRGRGEDRETDQTVSVRQRYSTGALAGPRMGRSSKWLGTSGTKAPLVPTTCTLYVQLPTT